MCTSSVWLSLELMTIYLIFRPDGYVFLLTLLTCLGVPTILSVRLQYFVTSVTYFVKIVFTNNILHLKPDHL